MLTPSAAGLRPREEIAGIPVRRYRYAPLKYETLAYTGTMASTALGSPAGWLALGGMLSLGSRSLGALVREAQPDVVHAHWWFPSGLQARVALASSIPLVTTLHGSDVRLADKVPGAPSLLTTVARRSQAMTAVSSWLAQQATALTGGVAQPDVSPMPAATDLFVPGTMRVMDRLLFVGRLNEQKGLARLLRSMASLVRPVTLDVVGDGPDRAALQELAQSSGVGSRVRWHGARPQSELAQFYQAASLFVMPSVDEGLGLTAVEAQLCETPVVAFRSGGLTDIVANDESGLLVSPGNEQELAAAIDRVLGDVDLATRLGRQGRDAALRTFAPEAAARRYRTLYDRVSSRAA